MIETQLAERIAILQRTRSAAALALAGAVGVTQDGLSERGICDQWTLAISRNTSVSPEGWYQPPPKGASILIGNPEDNFARMNYDSLRNPSAWPRPDILLREESLIYAYASPFDCATGIIGDIGITLYQGTNQSIRDHLIRCLDLTARIASFSEVGMELRELFRYAQIQIDAANLSNQAASTKSGVPNIGHTIPWTFDGYPDETKKCFDVGNAQDIRDAISKARVSINDLAALRIQPTMAFTVEPQIASGSAPLCSYHVIVTFSDGKRTISPSFEPLFKTFGMAGYMRAVLAQLS